MTPTILLISLCYAALAVLLVALCLHTRWPFLIKTVMILLSAVFALATHDAIDAMLGYAVSGRLPERFLFHHAVIVPPDRAAGRAGAIYLWATALTPDGPLEAPRAYALPFDKDTYEMLTESLKRAKAGIAQMGSAQGAVPRPGGNALSQWLSGRGPQTLRMVDKPDPALPEK